MDGRDTADFPVDSVKWESAKEFCLKLSRRPVEEKQGQTYWLPTEAQWEYACRADTPTPFAFGNSLDAEQANFDGKFPYGKVEKGAYLKRTCKVGSYKPNLWGLHDMHGNVWEWCADWYDKDYYKPTLSIDPEGPGKPREELRVIRGGSWDSKGYMCRSAQRKGFRPEAVSRWVGFRVVMSLKNN